MPNMRCLFLSFLLFAIAMDGKTLAQRADALGIDGIYEGRIGMQLDKQKGKAYDAPAKFVFLPDGRGAILTAQHPDGVVAVVLKGALSGRTFIAESGGKLDYGGYHYGMRWDVVFDPKLHTATLHGKATNLPKWAHDDDLRYTFRKKAGK
jgi:hypothetical protein